MARIRNQKSSPTELSHRRKRAVKSKPSVDSSDEDNLVTEGHETNDVRVRAFVHLRDRFSTSGLVKQPNLAADVSTFLKDLHVGSSKKNLGGKAKEDVPPTPSEKPNPKEKKPSDKGSKSQKKGKEPEEVFELPLSKPIQPKSSTKFVFPPSSQWYSVIPPLPPITSISTPNPTQTSSLLTKAASLHAADVRNYNASGVSTGSTSDSQFLRKVLQSGTLSDRLSAMTLLVQGSPMHNVKSLDSLKNMAGRGKGKGGREESLKALRCIVDWWVGGGAPDRKLK